MKISNQKIIYCLKNDTHDNLNLSKLHKYFLSPDIYMSSHAKDLAYDMNLAKDIYSNIFESSLISEEIILINNDVLIDGLIFRFLNSSKVNKSLIFVEHNLKMSSDSYDLYFDGKYFSNTYSGQGYKYWGVCKLLSLKIAQLPVTKSFLSMTNALIDSNELDIINITDIINTQGKYIGGGSHASSKMEIIFSKQASGLGCEKLKDEINYLNAIPSQLKELFPKVNSYYISDNLATLKLEYLPYPTLRDLLFSGKFYANDAFNIITQIIIKLQAEYQKNIMPVPGNYLEKIHLERLYKRLQQTISLSPIFKQIIEADSIVINNICYKNIYEVIQIINQPNILNLFKPDHLSSLVHGDLHFENILIDPINGNFKLIDPRGYSSCDIFYDLGKLSHSTNGKYDFIHENKLKINYTITNNIVNIDMQFYNTAILRVYNELNNKLKKFYCKNIQGDNIMEKVLFNEAMHFCSDMPFQLVGDNLENRAVAIYATGIMVFNKLIKQLFLIKRSC